MNSAVRIITFSSTRVGCEAFQMAFRHLERTGRLLHARFVNTNDLAPLLPLRSKGYRHVGMQVRLHRSNYYGRWRIRRALDVTYNHAENLSIIFMQLAQSCLPSVWKSGRICEYQHRMHVAREYRLALGMGVLRFDKRRRNLKSLNDYYLYKCRLEELADAADVKKKGWSLNSMSLAIVLASVLLTFETVLLFKFIS